MRTILARATPQEGHAMTTTTQIAFGVLSILLAQASQEIRIDTFDEHSNRTGYLIVNPNTGRVDQFDTRSNRLGYGTYSTPMQPNYGRGSDVLDRYGRSVTIDRKDR
jgi:hypothetical protein